MTNDQASRNSYPIASGCAAFDDPATIGMLIAIVQLCLQLPGSIPQNCYDDVGYLLHPLVSDMRITFADSDHTADKPEWIEQFNTVSSESDYDCYLWLGKNLARVSRNLVPMYRAILDNLHQAHLAMSFTFAPNVQHLGDIFGLDDVERRILALAACTDQSSFGFRYLYVDRPAAKVYQAIAAAIAMPVERVAPALQWGSKLARSGILQSSFDGTAALREALDLTKFGKQLFCRPFESVDDLFNAILIPIAAPANTLSLRCPSLAAEQRTVQAILKTALSIAEPGINILLHGAPGTGKTEFARHLVDSAHHAGYEVPYEDKDGNEASRVQRLAGLHTAQCMLGNARLAVLVFDEAEDIFMDALSSNGRSGANGRTGSKAWMNRLLETNAHPVIWITNSIEGIDPAYLRRFTFCIHFDTPDASVRRQIAQQHLESIGVTGAIVDCVAQRKEFSPALIPASARVAQLAAGKAGSQDEVVMCHLNSHAKTMQLPAISAVPQAVTRFDSAYLQLEGRFSAQQIIDALVRRGTGTVLMSGPPGTGKTQLAKTIAERLGRELLYYTASDINRKWFGESEQQVARMFTTCNPAQQVLFLDEAGTVLSARESAQHRGLRSRHRGILAATGTLPRRISLRDQPRALYRQRANPPFYV